jgi:DNA-binding NarL/FixJ family response regulator/class 3 adenylate cyclase
MIVSVPRDLLAGTVTFLFTDVEGSTRLLHELGTDRYAHALAEHRRILRETFSAHGGVEVDTQGDAFFVAFPTAPEAVRAATQAVEELSAGPIQVRIGIHTGTPHLGEDGYVGVDVHRAARIAAAGHGGQVLVSASTAALLASDELRDLGEHRLKDLTHPQRLYQLVIPGLETEFPPLKTLKNHPTNSRSTMIRIVLAEDTYLVREGIRRLLEPEPDIELAAACADLPSLLEAIEMEQPDVVLTDIRMPPTNRDEGIQVADRLRDTSPETGVVVLSQFAAPEYALALLEKGADRRGYLLKDRVGDAAELAGAIRQVARGGSVIDPKIIEALVAARARSDSPLDELTPRERETLEEMAQGKNNAAIADSLVITERSVEKVIHSILQKLGVGWEPDVNRRVKAVLLYLAEREG